MVSDGEGLLYISDTGNTRIRVVDLEGDIGTIAGSGAPGHGDDNGRADGSKVSSPGGLFLAREGVLFFVDSGNHGIPTTVLILR